jgi:phosphinothricin acetyltransferase
MPRLSVADHFTKPAAAVAMVDYYTPVTAVTDLSIREANPDDVEAIARIYNQGIEDHATLETAPRSPDERGAWLAARGRRHPVIVAVDSHTNQIVGWASLNQFNPRAAYDNVVDISVYVAREARGRGVGSRLLPELEVQARRIGYHKMVLAGFPWNTAGTRLYERCGFQVVGTYHEQGLLDGEWVDVILMEKLLG